MSVVLLKNDVPGTYFSYVRTAVNQLFTRYSRVLLLLLLLLLLMFLEYSLRLF